MTRTTNIGDVAALAGVSAASVSRVMTGSRTVKPETRERVEQAVAELGYIPNQSARSLKLSRSNLFACVIPDIANPFFPELVRGVEDIAIAQGYGTLLCNTDDDPLKEAAYLDLLAQRRIDGLIMIPSRDEEPPAGLHRLMDQGTPVVVIDRLLQGFEGDSIMVDNRLGGMQAAQHLVELGHRRIAIINRSLDTSTARLRQDGYEEVLISEALLDDSLVKLGSFTFEFGRDAARELLSSAPDARPTAILAGSDVLAISALQTVHEIGLQVPDDISIVGFDGIAMSQLMSPPLTTVKQPIYQMAHLAANLLVERARGTAKEDTTWRTLQPSLHVGASTGPAK
jgi:LacI family transcriptional regulator, galactose operon repressor